MLEELKNTDIVNKLGGRFKMTALIQRRVGELMQGSRPLIEDAQGKSYMEIAVQEILQDKIFLDMSSEVRIAGESSRDGGPPELDLEKL